MDVPVLATSTTSPPRPRSAPWCRPSRTWSRSGQDLADEELVAVRSAWRRSYRGVLQLLPSKYVLPVVWLHWSRAPR